MTSKTVTTVEYRYGNQEGFSIAETMIAVAFALLAGVLVMQSMVTIAKQAKRSAALGTAISLQSEILSALQDQTQFQANDAAPSPQLQAIRDGNEAGTNGLQLRSIADQRVIAISGKRIGFTASRDYCDPGSTDCLIRVELQFGNCTPAPCRSASYRVSLADKALGINSVPLGAPRRTTNLLYRVARGNFARAQEPSPDSRPASRTETLQTPHGLIYMQDVNQAGQPPSFSAGDFSIPVLYDIRDQRASDRCEADDVFVTGVNRSTGQVRCLSKATESCPTGTIAKGLTIASGRLSFACQPLATAQCPTDYVWNKIDLSSLDRPAGFQGGNVTLPRYVGQQERNVCTYRWRDNVPWQAPWPTGARSVSGIFCRPGIYYPVPTGQCVYRNVRSQNGPGGVPSLAPPIQRVNTTTGEVSCAIGAKTEPAGSSITADVYWEGTCRIDRNQHPEFREPI